MSATWDKNYSEAFPSIIPTSFQEGVAGAEGDIFESPKWKLTDYPNILGQRMVQSWSRKRFKEKSMGFRATITKLNKLGGLTWQPFVLWVLQAK